MQPNENPTNNQPVVSQPQPGVNSDYNFILNPEKPKKSIIKPTSNNPMINRVVVVVGGLIILFILFLVIKGLISKPAVNTAAFNQVLQDQALIIQVLGQDMQGLGNVSSVISTNNKNFQATAILSISSDQSLTINYLKKNGVVVKSANLLVVGSDTVISGNLKNALSSNNFNSTFTSTMEGELNTYKQDLSIAYSKTNGAKGKNLLNNSYKNASLLIKQLNSPLS